MVGSIGVLALQGAFAKHAEMLHRLGINPIEVRYPEQLNLCMGLILPGGESTTMTRQIESMELLEPLQKFAQTKPLFGTCAGMILMANLLGILDISVERNAYGRQCASFETPLQLSFSADTLLGIFIRAPRITRLLSPDVHVLSTFKDEPVCIQQGHHLAASFHPELTNDPILHQYYIHLCKAKLLAQPLSTTTPTKSFLTT